MVQCCSLCKILFQKRLLMNKLMTTESVLSILSNSSFIKLGFVNYNWNTILKKSFTNKTYLII